MSDHTLTTLVACCLLTIATALAVLPAAGQTFNVQNGATVQVQNNAALNLEGGTMDLGPAGSTALLDEQSDGRVTGGTLTATRSLDAPTDADPAGLGAVLSASVNLGDVAVTRGHTVQTTDDNTSIARYYDIAPSQNNSSLDAELTFTYHDNELEGLVEDDLELFKSTDGGSTWTQEGADSRSTDPTGGNTVSLGGIESFSRWTLASNDAPLPVELAGFEAQRSGSESVTLQWQTLSETNNAGFEVQRATGSVNRSGDGPTVETSHWGVSTSDSGESWQTLARLDGAGTTDTPQSYQFEDTDLPYAADSLSYRLRQIDTDGSESFSDPITVARQVTDAELLPAYPNPARSQAAIRFAVPERQDVRIALYDMLGRRVQTVVDTDAAGRTEAQLDVSDLASGTYFLRMQTDGFADTQRLTVVR